MKVRIRTTWRKKNNAATDKPSFAELQQRHTRGAATFVSSLGMHLGTVWLMGSMVQAVNQRRAMVREPQLERALEMPAAAVLQAPRLFGETMPGHKPAQKSAGPPHLTKTAKAETNASSSVEAPIPIARQGKRSMFPVEIAHTPDKQILVQLESPPDLKPKSRIAVPEVMLWQLRAPLKAKPQVMAAPEKPKPVQERETPASPPQLTARNQEEQLANYRHADSPPVPDPRLPLPVANTTPVRLLDAIKGNRLPGSTRPPVAAPEAVHVISVPDPPVPEARMVALPPGNLAPLPGVPAGSSAGGGRATPSNDAQSNAARESQRRAEAASGSGQSDAHANSTVYVGPGAGHNAGTLPGDSRPSPAAGNASAAAVASPGPPPPGTTRIDRPRDGKYSVVVLGNSNLDAYPEAAGILSGKLVYSVYVRVGGRKEWILQYCLPRAVEQSVKLRGSAVPIQAPYPFLIYYPKLTLQNDPDYLIIHGMISPAGRFEQLSALGDIDPANKQLLLGALEHWEFRPASRDGEPNAVEIALIIPREPI